MKAGTIIRLGVLALVTWLVVRPTDFAWLFAAFARQGQPVIYNQGSLLGLTLNHLMIVAGAMGISAAIAITLAILVTRPAGAEFLPLSRAVVNIGQTVPPVAVLALCVPLLGFGTSPTLIALFLYGLLPLFENSLTGLTGIPPTVTDAAEGMGMTPWQQLVKVDIPLALPLILTGLRLSTVIALSTATIGSTVAASTLGEVIIAGLQSGNTAFVVQGGVIVGAIAVLINDGFLALERWQRQRSGQM